MNKLIFVLIIISIFSTFTYANENKAPFVYYAAKNNELSIKAEKASLTAVLRQISLATGLEIKIDPKIESDITLAFRNKQLDQAMHYVLKGFNTFFVYSDENKKDNLLLSINVLPNGVNTTPNLVAVTLPETNAISFGNSYTTPNHSPSPEELDYFETRWATRVQHLPLDQREKLEEITQKASAIQQQLSEQHKAIRDNFVQDFSQSTKTNDREEDAMMQSDAERYALREERKRALIGKFEN